MATGCAFPP